MRTDQHGHPVSDLQCKNKSRKRQCQKYLGSMFTNFINFSLLQSEMIRVSFGVGKKG